ncbi:MAG: translation initiation factor IF-2 [Fibrobacterota bacterium]
MGKEKVYEIAKKRGLSSKALISVLKELGFNVKSHMGVVEDDMKEAIENYFKKEIEEIKHDQEKKAEVSQRKTPKKETKTEKIEKKKTSPLLSSAPDVAGRPLEQPKKASKEDYNEFLSKFEKDKEKAQSAESTVESIKKDIARLKRKSSHTSKPQTAPEEKTVPGRKGKKKKKKSKKVDEAAVAETLKATLADLSGKPSKKRHKKEEKLEDGTEEPKILKVPEFVTVAELAGLMSLSSSEVISTCMTMGLMVTANQRLDFETISMVADEFGFDAKLLEEYSIESHDVLEEEEKEDDEASLKPRPPVVTVMGHVDHGKTSLLDYIRETNVIAGESGGITQHIAAYEVITKHGPVTFLDTPGHEAFTAMRARGVNATDVVVLIVAADDGVKETTLEAIDHIKAAGVPVVVAINKIDLPNANPEMIKTQLASHNILLEGWGGQISFKEISCKTGEGIDELLELLALETEILELKANPDRKASGVVIESELDKGRGVVVTFLVKNGTIRVRDAFVAGPYSGKVKLLLDERGHKTESAEPGCPVRVLGLDGTPQAGDTFNVVSDEKKAREISSKRMLAQKEREYRMYNKVSLNNLFENIKAGQVSELRLIIKGDVDGSVEALSASLEKASNDQVKVNVIMKSVGSIKESDVNLAAASGAIIIGFHVSPNTKIKELAIEEGVDIRQYTVIYKCVEDIQLAMVGMLPPEEKIVERGKAEVRQIFKASKIGNIAGCYVKEGVINRNVKIKVVREGEEILETSIDSLKRVKDEVKEVSSGYECGILLKDNKEIKEGDELHAFEVILVKAETGETQKN